MSTLISARAADVSSASNSTVPATLTKFALVSSKGVRAFTSTCPRITWYFMGSGGDALKDQRRDVVGAAGAVRGVDQLGDHALQRLRTGDDLQNLVVLDHARQPVGAHEVEVAVHDLVRPDVHLHR